MRVLFPYTLVLTAPALLTRTGGDPNSSATLPFIPGGALRGAVAARLGDPDSKEMQETQRFDDLILSGRVRYLNAYPAEDMAPSPGLGVRSLPTPLSWRKPKYASRGERDRVIDSSFHSDGCSDEPEQDVYEQLVPVSFPFVVFSGGEMRGLSVRTRTRAHHQRSRTKERPIVEQGTVFVYEALDAGQTFQGFISIEAETMEEARCMAEELANCAGPVIGIGRSRRSGYGGQATFRLYLEGVSRELETYPALKRDLKSGDLFRVLLTSDYIGRNVETGQIDPASFLCNLERAVGVPFQVVTSNTGFSVTGGYNRKARLALPQTLALSAGSIFTLQARGDIPQSRWTAIEAMGLGERLTEGFGRFLFLEPAAASEGAVRLSSARKQPGEQPAEEQLDEMSRLILDFMQRRLLASRLDVELDVAVQTIVGRGPYSISSSLLGRLRVPLRGEPGYGLRVFREWLSEGPHMLRPAALKQLKACRLANGKTLNAWLSDVINDPVQIGELLNFGQLSNSAYLVSKEHARRLLESQTDELRIRLIDGVLAAISRSVRSRAGCAGKMNTASGSGR